MVTLQYQFVALPFGLSCAPWVITKVPAPVLALMLSCYISRQPPFEGTVDAGSVRQHNCPDILTQHSIGVRLVSDQIV